MSCQHTSTEIRLGTPPHAAALHCKGCGQWLKWLSKKAAGIAQSIGCANITGNSTTPFLQDGKQSLRNKAAWRRLSPNLKRRLESGSREPLGGPANESQRIAISYAQAGLSVIPLQPDTKKPMRSWKHWQYEIMSPSEIAAQFADSSNIGIVCGQVSGIVVVDADSPDAFPWVLEHFGLTPVAVATPHGRHFYYAYAGSVPNMVRVAGRLVDIRSDGGFVVAPPSSVSGKPYLWLAEFTRGMPQFRPGAEQPGAM